MLTVACVLKSGGIYDAEWVRKLRDAVGAHLPFRHRFACLSDVPVPCERIPLAHDWPGWWSKIELFAPGVITGPTLYLDLDTVIVGRMDPLTYLPNRFLMMKNFHRPEMPGSSVMWFGAVPTDVYERFAQNPKGHMAYHQEKRRGPYLGDQAFIWETLGRQVKYIDDYIPPGLVCSYKKHCGAGVPPSAGLVAFGGPNKPSTVPDPWVRAAWA